MPEVQPWLVSIDKGQFHIFWQKIGGNQEQIPSIVLEEYPDEETRKHDKKEKQRTLGLHTDDNTIHIFYKNFPDACYENKDSFHEEITDIFAHEVSHARLTQGNVGIRSLLHNSAQWILQNLIISAISAFTLFLGSTFFGLVTWLSLPHIITFSISVCISFLATCAITYVLGNLLHQYREAVTDSYAADLIRIHKNDLMNMVCIIVITDALAETAYGQFLLGYHSISLAAKRLR